MIPIPRHVSPPAACWARGSWTTESVNPRWDPKCFPVSVSRTGGGEFRLPSVQPGVALTATDRRRMFIDRAVPSCRVDHCDHAESQTTLVPKLTLPTNQMKVGYQSLNFFLSLSTSRESRCPFACIFLTSVVLRAHRYHDTAGKSFPWRHTLCCQGSSSLRYTHAISTAHNHECVLQNIPRPRYPPGYLFARVPTAIDKPSIASLLDKAPGKLA
jgi:hypothetical protein